MTLDHPRRMRKVYPSEVVALQVYPSEVVALQVCVCVCLRVCACVVPGAP